MMENDLYIELLKELEELKVSVDIQTAKKLSLDLLERIIKRLGEFSPECDECSQSLNELEKYIKQLKDKQGGLDKNDLKQNSIKLNSITSHLQKQHKLVTEGCYLSIFMCLGMSIGLVFGLTIFDNIALGLPIGMGIGVAIGSGMDADAKKKGMVI